MRFRFARSVPLALGALLATGLGAGTAHAQSIPVRLGGEASSLTGLEFELPIEIDMTARTEKLGSVAMTIRWDTLVLRFVNGVNGNMGNVQANEDSLRAGVAKLTSVNPAGVGGRVILGVLRFVPRLAATTTLRLEVTELYAAGTFADLIGSAVPSDRAYCPAVGRFADVDGDGSGSSRDALLVLSHAVGRDISGFGNPALGDVDGDGLTGARDALVILSAAVGLDVTGFRVFRVAPGACATARRPVLAILPGGTTLDLGQQVQLLAVATDSTGAGVTTTDVVWSTSNPQVATVEPHGRVTGVAAGTATIRAFRIGGGGGLATATMTVTQRRVHWVDAFAFTDERQIGSAELPFATIQQGVDYAQPGDTVRVRPGRYEGTVQVARRVAILGDSVGGRRAVITTTSPGGGEGYGPAGVEVVGGGNVSLANLVIDGFETGVNASVLLDTLVLEGVQIIVGGTCANAAVDVEDVRLLVVRRSQLIGDGQFSGCATGINVDESAALVLVEDVAITDFGSHGIYANNTDSVVVRRSSLNDNYYYGVGAEGGTGTFSPNGSVALVIEDSRLLRNYYEAVVAYELRAGRIVGSVIDMLDYDDAISVSGVGTGYLILSRDSIRVDDYDWIDVDGLDSVVVDSTRVTGAYEGYFYNIRLVRATRSSFLDTYGSVFDISYGGPPPAGGGLVVDSVHVRGAADCSECAEVVDAYETGVSVNRLLAENVDYGIYAYYADSGVSVTNSEFRDAYQAIYTYSYASPRPRLTVRNVTIDEAYYGIEAGNMVAVIESVTVSGSVNDYQAIELWGGGEDTVRYATVTGYDYGVEADSSLTVTNSQFQNTYEGIYVYNSQSPRARLTVRSVTMDRVYYGIEAGNVVAVIDSVTLNGTVNEYEGIYTWGGGADTVRNSRITGYDYQLDLNDSVAYAADNMLIAPTYDGFYHYRSPVVPADTSVFINNVVTCDARGAQDAGGFDFNRVAHRIEGNTVTGCNWGIYVSSGDATLASIIRNNTVSIPSVADYPGIYVAGYRTNVVGNTVTGGAPYADGSIRVLPYFSRVPFARIDSNVVRGAQVWGIRAESGDSLLIRDNLVEDFTVPVGYAYAGGISAAYNAAYHMRIARNTLRRIHGVGIHVYQPDTATVTVDTNAVSAADTAAVQLVAGRLLMRGNNIRNNARYGLHVSGATGFVHRVDGNAFQGNALYAVLSPNDSVDASGNWWGVDGALPGTPGADSVSGRVNFTAPLASEPSGLPPLAPRLVAAAPAPTLVAPAAATAVAVPPVERLERATWERATRPERVARTKSPKVAKSQVSPAASAAGAQFERLQVRSAQRTERDTMRAQVRDVKAARQAEAQASRAEVRAAASAQVTEQRRARREARDAVRAQREAERRARQ